VFAAPFLALLFYAVPATDDYCKATLSYDGIRQPGVWALIWRAYLTWSPRWLTLFLQSSFMPRVDLVGSYGWLLLMVVLVTLASLCCFFAKVLRLPPVQSLLAASVFYAAWLAVLAQPSENFYWLACGTEYQLPLCVMLVLASLLVHSGPSARNTVAIALLSFAVPAQHELAGAFLCAMLLFALIIVLWRRLPAFRWILSFTLAALSFAIVVLCPGISGRAANEHRHLGPSAALLWTLSRTILQHTTQWLFHPVVWIAGISIGLLSWPAGRRLPAKWLALAGLLGMGILLVESSLVELTLGQLPGRVVGLFQFQLWLLLVCVSAAGVSRISRTKYAPALGAAVMLCLVASLFTSPNFRAAVDDLRGPAAAYRRNLSGHLEHPGKSPVNLSGSPNPHLFLNQWISAHPGCWVNRCVANYIGAQQVIGSSFIEPCPSLTDTPVALPEGPEAGSFFAGEVFVGNAVHYLAFPNRVSFGYFTFQPPSTICHVQMGCEYVTRVNGDPQGVKMFDYLSGHWFYTSAMNFPYLYDFTLKVTLYYHPDPDNPGSYTKNPRYFTNMSTKQVFTM
jgi:hypothetical protein